MNQTVKTAYNKAHNAICDEGKKLSAADYLEYMEELASSIEAKIEAHKDDYPELDD